MTTRLALAAVLTGPIMAGACASPCAAEHDRAVPLARPDRPEPCVAVGPAVPLQAALERAAPGAALCLAPGRYPGPIVIDHEVTVWGPADAVIVSSGEGTTVRITGDNAALLGVTIDGSGGRYDLLDAAVSIAADDVAVEGVTVVRAVYGILAEKSHRVRIHGNHVMGSDDPALGMRGDTIRLWETVDSEVSDNQVDHGRDVVIWYSRRNRITGNRVHGSRYGTHFMYSHGNLVEGNQYVDVTVGVFVMYTRDITLRGNVIANAAGAAGIAIGLKDSGTVRIEDNLLVRDQTGIYIDATPQQPDEELTITGNQLRLCRTAIVFHASLRQVDIRGNDFASNELNTRVDGGGDALAVVWDGNYFDDYAGYDLDGDGTGDVAYELRSFSGELVARHPELGFFNGTPALSLADAAAHLDPLYQPKALLIDPRPRMAPVAGRAGRASVEVHP